VVVIIEILFDVTDMADVVSGVFVLKITGVSDVSEVVVKSDE